MIAVTDYKRYVFECIGIVITLIFCIIIFNYWQDSADIFSNEKIYRSEAIASCSGESLIVSGNYNERLFIKSVLKYGINDYDVLVFGSSRAMFIGEKEMPVKLHLRNLAVSGGSLYDDIAIWHAYVENEKKTPQMVVIGVDPWIFNHNNGETRWKETLFDEYAAAMKNWGLTQQEKRNFDIYKSLLSISYTRESIKKLFTDMQPLAVLENQESVTDGKQIMYADGSHEYSKSDEYGTGSEEKAKKYIGGKVYQLEEYDVLDDKLKNDFSVFIKNIQDRGIKVVFFLPPYHPIVYEYLSREAKYRKVLEAEQWFKDYARENGIVVVGSYDPKAIGLDGDAFIDGMHMKRHRNPVRFTIK